MLSDRGVQSGISSCQVAFGPSISSMMDYNTYGMRFHLANSDKSRSPLLKSQASLQSPRFHRGVARSHGTSAGRVRQNKDGEAIAIKPDIDGAAVSNEH